MEEAMLATRSAPQSLDPEGETAGSQAQSPARPRGLDFPERRLPFAAPVVAAEHGLSAIPPPVLREIEPVMDLLDGRSVALILADSPLSPHLTLRVLERLVDSGAARLAIKLSEEPTARVGASSEPPSIDPPAPIPVVEADTLRMPVAGRRARAEPSVIVDLELALVLPSVPPPAVATAPEILAPLPLPVEVNRPIPALPPPAEIPPASPSLSSSSSSSPSPSSSPPPSPPAAPETFSAFEESFFASEAPEIKEARELAAAGDLSSVSGTFRRPPRRAFSLAALLAAAVGWLGR